MVIKPLFMLFLQGQYFICKKPRQNTELLIASYTYNMYVFQAHSLKLPNCGGVDVCFTGMRDSFKQTVKANGIEGLWRGLIPTLLKVNNKNSIHNNEYSHHNHQH